MQQVNECIPQTECGQEKSHLKEYVQHDTIHRKFKERQTQAILCGSASSGDKTTKKRKKFLSQGRGHLYRKEARDQRGVYLGEALGC